MQDFVHQQQYIGWLLRFLIPKAQVKTMPSDNLDLAGSQVRRLRLLLGVERLAEKTGNRAFWVFGPTPTPPIVV